MTDQSKRTPREIYLNDTSYSVTAQTAYYNKEDCTPGFKTYREVIAPTCLMGNPDACEENGCQILTEDLFTLAEILPLVRALESYSDIYSDLGMTAYNALAQFQKLLDVRRK